ncbi:MAG: ATP-grasp domain-containing protein [Spirochaetaceae bacterium]|jgi:acetyl/propionyl-CoA carboxylase alpha subunit/acetyl-CoA carboxylase carboxyltransferase component|nr:ATP-grasp domain-containing protein [Spirochaetaceae bacterium]
MSLNMIHRLLQKTDRIGILNRGEAALRFIRAVKEYNDLYDTDLKTIALYIDKEENAPFVKSADFDLPLSSLSLFPGKQQSPYLDHELMLEALKTSNCQAVWVGWGFVSEDSDFVKKIEENNITFMGPSSVAMALLGDKIAAKELADISNVPILPWSKGPVKTLKEARIISEKIGYPVIVKASNAGGGRGIRFVKTPEELEKQYNSAKEETLRITGNDVVFIELLVEKGRHLEVQVLADSHGNINTFGARDCSAQRKNQKIIEETPPPNFSNKIVKEMEAAASRLIKAAAYIGAGTVEYLYDLNRKEFYFMEVNTRLQVEHPITETLYQIDLVKGQIDVAMGNIVDLSHCISTGAVIEVRLNAEDPDKNFSPSPGLVTLFNPPAGAGIRVDSGIEQGSLIPSDFDSMVAKVIAFAPTRKEAISRLKRALNEMSIGIENGTTNKAFLLELLNQKEIQKGGIHTGFVEELISRGKKSVNGEKIEIALIAGALDQYYKNYKKDFYNFKQQLIRTGRPRHLPDNLGYEVTLAAQGNSYTFVVKQLGENCYEIGYEDQIISCKSMIYDNKGVLIYNEKRYNILLIPRGDQLQCEIDGFPVLLESDSGGWVRSPSPAIILSINCKKGQLVKKGDVLGILEAMKMEMLVEAPFDGTIKEITVSSGEQISAGQPMIMMESEKEVEKPVTKTTPLVKWKTTLTEDSQKYDSLQRELLGTFLGYDHRENIKNLLDHMKNHIQTNMTELLLQAIEYNNIIERLFQAIEVETTSYTRPLTYQEMLSHYFRRDGDREKGLPDEFIKNLEMAINCYSVPELSEDERQNHALFHIFKSHNAINTKELLLKEILLMMQDYQLSEVIEKRFTEALNELISLWVGQSDSVVDMALHLLYTKINRIKNKLIEEKHESEIRDLIEKLHVTKDEIIEQKIYDIADSGSGLTRELIDLYLEENIDQKKIALKILGTHLNRDQNIINSEVFQIGDKFISSIQVESEGNITNYLITVINEKDEKSIPVNQWIEELKVEKPHIIILVKSGRKDQITDGIVKSIKEKTGEKVKFLSIGIYPENDVYDFRTYQWSEGWQELLLHRGFSPLQYRELRVFRLINFDTNILYKSENVTLLEVKSRENDRDIRLFAYSSISVTEIVLSTNGDVKQLIEFESVLTEAAYAMRSVQALYKYRLQWNRVIIHNRSLLNLRMPQMKYLEKKFVKMASGLGMQRLVFYTRRVKRNEKQVRDLELLFVNITQEQYSVSGRKPATIPLKALDSYTSSVIKARQKNMIYPYEFIKMITYAGYPLLSDMPHGDFEEFDIVNDKTLSVKGRDPGLNSSNIVFGIISNFSKELNIHIERVIILADPTRDLGSLAEMESRCVIAALDMAEEKKIPVEWIPISSGAKINMDSGTENLDWTASTLKRIIEFTQNGGEINIIVPGINVGAQSYWNAEATMLMHTRGLLIMTEHASMLLTGKKALDFSGSVSGTNNLDIGGAEKIMIPNGQAQIRVPDIASAYSVLFNHYNLTYIEPGSYFPAKKESTDDSTRDISKFIYKDFLGQGFEKIGDIFSFEKNPDRKKPFDIRQVMLSVIDRDSEHLERWRSMEQADTAVVWETRIGGYAAGLISIESRNIHRIGAIPFDGPEMWSGGTLFPQSSKKIARAINAFSGHLPLVVLANLSGFDGSPESLRNLQLEYGAEIGRGIVNFKGPIIFVVIARYHGGAYVVFSKSLNPAIRSAALEGSYASVIGGAPAAAVVFPKIVSKEVYKDERVLEKQKELNMGKCTPREYQELFNSVYNEKQKELADKFDKIHSVQRATKVGSIDDIITVSQLRPYIIEEIKKGMAKHE